MSFDERALFLPSSTWLDRASMELSINSATATWGHLGPDSSCLKDAIRIFSSFSSMYLL